MGQLDPTFFSSSTSRPVSERQTAEGETTVTKLDRKIKESWSKAGVLHELTARMQANEKPRLGRGEQYSDKGETQTVSGKAESSFNVRLPPRTTTTSQLDSIPRSHDEALSEPDKTHSSTSGATTTDKKRTSRPVGSVVPLSPPSDSNPPYLGFRWTTWLFILYSICFLECFLVALALFKFPWISYTSFFFFNGMKFESWLLFTVLVLYNFGT